MSNTVSTQTAAVPVREERIHDQPAVRLSLPSGDSALVALQGAQVMSWSTPAGGEHLFLSERSLWDGRSAVRGGVPVCFPQFNQRGPLVKHGFARNLPWSLLESQTHSDSLTATFILRDDETTRAWWPHAFDARLVLQMRPGVLRISLELLNTGDASWSFTGALHSYLRVPEISGAQLDGLRGQARWDTVRDVRGVQQGEVRFDGEYDSVFAATSAPLRLWDEASRRSMRIENSPSWGNVVVWNPGAALCAGLADMQPDGYRQMLCVEAACVEQSVTLQPGERWSGWQQLDEWRA